MPSLGRRSYDREIVIARSPDDVFGYCSDLRNELDWNPDTIMVEKETPGPVGIGTRFRARWRRTPTTVVEVVAWDPPRSWTSRSTVMGMEVTTRGDVLADPAGARYRTTITLRPRGIARVVAPLVMRMMERNEARNVAAIKAVLEGSGHRRPASPRPRSQR